MFRKIAFAAFTTAALGAAALTPTSASALTLKVGPGWHPHHHWGVGFGPSFVVSDYAASCYQQRVVPTKKGPRLRIVNVCGYY